MASTEISVRLEPGLLQFAEAAAAAREDRSLSWLIRHALAEYARRSGDGTTRGVAARLHGSVSRSLRSCVSLSTPAEVVSSGSDMTGHGRSSRTRPDPFIYV